MSLMEIPFKNVDEAALQRLIDNGVRESLLIDYKLKLPGDKDADKKEFLQDVTAFANADGGDLLFGVRENKMVAVELVGVDANEAEGEILRLKNLCRDCVDPRIHGLRIQAVDVTPGRCVVHLRVPKSLDAPHMVRFKNHRQFWLRGSAGKDWMSSAEVRRVVMRTADWRDRADQWRRERVALLLGGESPVGLHGHGALLVHLVPMPTGGPELNLADEAIRRALLGVHPRIAHGWNHRMTYDGLLVARDLPGEGDSNYWYCLWFHNGRVEFVFSDLVSRKDGEDAGHIAGLRMEEDIEDAINRPLTVEVPGSVGVPVLVFITLVGVLGATLPLGPRYGSDAYRTPIERDQLLLPGLFIEEVPDDLWPFIAHAVNRIWQAAGYPRSPFLNPDGTRVPLQR